MAFHLRDNHRKIRERFQNRKPGRRELILGQNIRQSGYPFLRSLCVLDPEIHIEHSVHILIYRQHRHETGLAY